MKYSRQTHRRLSRVFSGAVLFLSSLPVMAGEAGQSVERFDQATQIWRLEQTAELQRVMEVEAMLDYAAQVERHASEFTEQATVVNRAKAVQPVVFPEPPGVLIIDSYICEPGRIRC